MQRYFLYRSIDDSNKFWQARGGWVERSKATAFSANDTHKYPQPARSTLMELEMMDWSGSKLA